MYVTSRMKPHLALVQDRTHNCQFILPSHQQQLEGEDGVSPWNVGKSSQLVAAICPRTFHWKRRHYV